MPCRRLSYSFVARNRLEPGADDITREESEDGDRGGTGADDHALELQMGAGQREKERGGGTGVEQQQADDRQEQVFASRSHSGTYSTTTSWRRQPEFFGIMTASALML
jgi:hypothetical protein